MIEKNRILLIDEQEPVLTSKNFGKPGYQENEREIHDHNNESSSFSSSSLEHMYEDYRKKIMNSDDVID